MERDILLRKANGWRYEKEWRLIGTPGLHASPLLLNEVIFGLRCSRAIIYCIVQGLKYRKKECKFYEIYQTPGEYRLRRRLIDLDELMNIYPIDASLSDGMFNEFIENFASVRVS